MFQTLLNSTSFYFWLAIMGGLFLIGYWVWKKRETVFSKIGVGPSVLQQFSRDLNQQAAEGKLDPVVGREEEIERVIQVLCRRNKNNPVLVGKAGVGKTAIAEGLAQAIVAKKFRQFYKTSACWRSIYRQSLPGQSTAANLNSA